ncbi:MAG: hypothetical protein WA900_15725 [Casimicrobiaceae bacterium]
MNELLIAAKKEQEELRRQRAAIDARLAELDAFLRVLPTITAHAHIVEAPDTFVARATVSAPATTIKDKILERCKRLLSDGTARHTRDLVTYLRAEGVELKGKDPVLQVSSVLSRDSRFKASRSIGWTLVAQNGEGSGASTPEPSDSRQLPLSTAVPQQPHP